MRKRNPVIAEIAKKAGGIVALSEKLGLSRAAASQWTEIPIDHLDEIERLFGVPRERQRPDIFRRKAA